MYAAMYFCGSASISDGYCLQKRAYRSSADKLSVSSKRCWCVISDFSAIILKNRSNLGTVLYKSSWFWRGKSSNSLFSMASMFSEHGCCVNRLCKSAIHQLDGAKLSKCSKPFLSVMKPRKQPCRTKIECWQMSPSCKINCLRLSDLGLNCVIKKSSSSGVMLMYLATVASRFW